jgi:acyl-CoA synthetase (AMP-forming)/AMP-acid ligase II
MPSGASASPSPLCGALDEARLHAWCRDRLVIYQRPRTLLFVDALPKNTLGKVLRRELVASVIGASSAGASASNAAQPAPKPD